MKKQRGAQRKIQKERKSKIKTGTEKRETEKKKESETLRKEKRQRKTEERFYSRKDAPILRRL